LVNEVSRAAIQTTITVGEFLPSAGVAVFSTQAGSGRKRLTVTRILMHLKEGQVIVTLAQL